MQYERYYTNWINGYRNCTEKNGNVSCMSANVTKKFKLVIEKDHKMQGSFKRAKTTIIYFALIFPDNIRYFFEWILGEKNDFKITITDLTRM